MRELPSMLVEVVLVELVALRGEDIYSNYFLNVFDTE